jgi:predicted Zn finger-like uncharacterized protein
VFTVCPKCALTLVVTAADLRVAQGYVRCGRCSNVFNALARLSEDKGAAGAAQAQGAALAPAPAPAATSTATPPKPQPTGTAATQPQTPAAPTRPPLPTGSFVYTKPPDPPAPAPTQRPAGASFTGAPPAAIPQPRGTQGIGAPAPQTTAPPIPPSRPLQQPAPPKQTSAAPLPPPSAARAPQPPPAPLPKPASVSLQAKFSPGSPSLSLPSELQLDDDDAIPEDALEFNADADVNQFFVEPPPNPEWTAATGTFKSIVLKSEEPTPPPDPVPSAPKPVAIIPPPLPTKAAPPPYPPPTEFNTTFEDDEIELDADFLSATAQMRKLQIGLGDMPEPVEIPKPREPVIPVAPQTHIAPSARMAPRGGAVALEPHTHPPAPVPPRTPAPAAVVAAPTRAQPKPAPLVLEPAEFPEPEVVSVTRAPATERRPSGERGNPQWGPARESPAGARAPVRAFGLEPEEPPSQNLSSLARSVEATTTIRGSIEPLPPERSLLSSATLWSVGTGALILLLAVQVVNHYRNDLAATPQFNKSITALYSAFGIQLTPRWDLHAYDVRQLGASVDAANAGEIMVRASVKNGAHQAQPMPLLRVTLQDRFGNRIAARDVPPGNYLPRSTADVGYLPAGQRIDAEMSFVDPGANAVGFEIDACLPAPAGGIACANDPVSR